VGVKKAHSSREKAMANLKPFVKGDPRINRTSGPKNAEAASYTIQAANYASRKISPEKFVDVLAEKVLRGIPWAVQMWADLFFDKKVEKHDVDVAFHVLDRVVKTEKET
jgi:hypothetical protein